MCGIAGLLNLDQQPASPVLVRAMTDALAHRGPDGEDIYTDGALGLGHRRLAIIDLSPGGRQPMLTQDGRYAITYNGELYNFQELRAELQAHGCRFQSRSDTEVLLQAWAVWGPAALNRFNGMFAFALWDAKERRLYLARDRYGIKPLYYRRSGKVLLFGSEAKALLAHPAGGAALDLPALMEYMTFQNFFTDHTLFKDVRLLPAGCYMAIDLARDDSRIERYWDYDFREPDEPYADEAEYAEELDRLFRQAVSRQLISDVDVASYLSGGIDSGSVTAVAASQLRNLRTFTVGFDLNSASGIEMGMDERREAEHMSYLFKTEQYEMVLKAGDMERCMPKLVRHLEEPRVGQSYPNFYAAQLAGKFVKVVLAGSGGDELFGGYPWRYYRAVVNDDFNHYIDKYYAFWQRLVPNSLLQPMFAPVANEVKGVWTRDIFRDVFHRHADQLTRPEDYVNHSLYFEAKTFLHGLLVVEDKLSMAHGLENRVPFLDNDLVDFAMRLPLSMKLGKLGEVVRLNENEPGAKTAKYFEKTRDGKLLLRKVMRRYVPDAISDGEKKGFSAPDASWFRGESIDYVKRVLGDKRARIYDYLDRSLVRQMVDEHLEGKQNRRLLIWSLLYLEEWCQQFLGGTQKTASAP
ncbi:asparagine synthase (glutamine-hydrolyzing) [Ferrovibrio sp.]|uniref:asparagine synthase (glutamine-hydrolyzing) n=1 Tax=Ferrovibrio sp. TaxID=1917215 RepID=UPI003D281447